MKKINNNLKLHKYQNILLINRLNIFILIYYKTSHEKNNYNIPKKNFTNFKIYYKQRNYKL